MTYPLLRTLLALAMAILVVVAVLFAAGTLVSLVSGEPLQTSLAVVTDRPVERAVAVSADAGDGVLRLTHGAITIRPGGLAYALQLLHVALILAAAFPSLWLLRKTILAIAAGDPFSAATIRRVRMLGTIQIATFLWTVVHQVLLQSILIPRLSLADGAAILSSIAWRKPGIENVQVDFTIGFGLLAAGLIALAVAEAFRIGANYREDSEAVV